MSSPQNINIIMKHKPSISGSSAMSYSPSSHTMPAIFQHRDSFIHQRELESAFCSDLVCCGMRVRDLHELLHHYEEHHHAPIEEEPEPKENEEDDAEQDTNVNKEGVDDDDDVMMDEDFPTLLPTQPHELAALTSSPLLRKNDLRINTLLDTASPISTPINLSPTTSMSSITSNNMMNQHTEEILKQALPTLSNPATPTANHSELHYFRSEALYQTCDDGQDKPYKCPIHGCDKAYKNPNGLKYHQMHGHSEEDSLSDAERDAQKPYMCTIGYCNKRYKNLNGLKYHIEHSHIAKLKQQQFPAVGGIQQQPGSNLAVEYNAATAAAQAVLSQQRQQQQDLQQAWQPPTF